MSTATDSILLPGQHAAPPGPVDLTSMYVMHHAFRRDLALFTRTTPTVPATDRAHWRLLLERWQIFATALHNHHRGEDSGLWPLLLSRVETSGDIGALEVLDAMRAEHALIDPVLERCERGLARLAAGGDESDRRTLEQSLDQAWTLLDGHLGHEERDAMAILQAHLDQSDWERVEREHFRAEVSLKQIWVLVPWSQIGLPDEVGRRVRSSAGSVVYLLWRLSRRSFARREAAAFGPAAAHSQSAT